MILWLAQMNECTPHPLLMNDTNLVTSIASGLVFGMHTISPQKLEPFLPQLGKRLQCPGDELYA